MTPIRPRGPTFVVIAGEASGHVIGGRLLAALRELTGGRAKFAGVGGERMIAEGLIPLFPMADLGVMGLGAVVERLPLLWRRLHQTAADAVTLAPDGVITIDSPGFNFRLARRLRARGVPLIHYVAPSVWAWRPGRAREIARFLDHLLLLFPFEKPYFDAVGLAATYVGHPVIEEPIGAADGAGFRRSIGLGERQALIAALPGSRADEVARLLPVFGAALGRLARRHPGLAAVVPTVPTVAGQVSAGVAQWPVTARVVTTVGEKYAAFAASNAALAASGTVTLELAAARVPMVVAYRASAATAFVARRLVTIPWVSPVNILAKEAVVPELLQGRCTPERLADALGPLIDDESARARQSLGLERVVAMLNDVTQPPSRTAARAVLDVLESFSARAGRAGA